MAVKDTDFPNRKNSDWEETSPETPIYNCIAYAAGRQDVFWWPDDYPGEDSSDYWPLGISREETIAAFVSLFVSIGYELCTDAAHEEGFEKVALYAKGDVPTHAAIQLPNGHWSSKLGPLEDIRHDTLAALDGPCYGKVVRLLRRKRSQPELKIERTEESTSNGTA